MCKVVAVVQRASVFSDQNWVLLFGIYLELLSKFDVAISIIWYSSSIQVKWRQRGFRCRYFTPGLTVGFNSQ